MESNSNRGEMMKKFMMGLILGAGLTFGLSAHAEVTSLVGSIIEGQFPVKVDGKAITAPGIVVNGTSYLPVREFGELLGYDVSFNADMGVELKKKVIANPAPANNEPGEPAVGDLQKKLKRVNQDITITEAMINAEKSSLELTPNNEEGKKRLADLEQKLERFKAEKAELEAQLEQMN